MNKSDPEAKPVSMPMLLGFDPKFNNKKPVIQMDPVITKPKLKNFQSKVWQF